jgi:serine/threonine-protein kinase
VIAGSDGIPRLIDFGIAKAAGRANVTREGQLKGKLPYMAPEQLQGRAVTPRTDVYGASVLLWELLVGARLFHSDGQTDVMGLVLSQPVVAPGSRRPGIPASLDAVALRGLDRNPERRFATAHEMALELERGCQLATAAEIGSWVQSTAQASLAERRQKVALLERQSSRPTSAVDRGERGPAASPRIDGHRDEGSTRVESARRPRGGFITRAWARIFGS